MMKQEAHLIGNELVLLLNLKRNPDGTYPTNIGSKTEVEIARLVGRIIKTHCPKEYQYLKDE